MEKNKGGEIMLVKLKCLNCGNVKYNDMPNIYPQVKIGTILKKSGCSCDKDADFIVKGLFVETGI